MSEQVGIVQDVTASILAATGTSVPPQAKPDGINLLPILAGRSRVQDRTLFFRQTIGTTKQVAVRQGSWKLLVDGDKRYVFDLSKDIGERNDLTNQRQDIARTLRPLITAWEADVDAEAKANAARETATRIRLGARASVAREVGRTYWELTPEMEIWLRLIPEDSEGKPPLVNLVFHAFFPGRAQRDPYTGLPQWPRGEPARLTVSAEPLPNTVTRELVLQLVVDGQTIDLTGPKGRYRNLPCLVAIEGCTPNASQG